MQLFQLRFWDPAWVERKRNPTLVDVLGFAVRPACTCGCGTLARWREPPVPASRCRQDGQVAGGPGKAPPNLLFQFDGIAGDKESAYNSEDEHRADQS